MGIFNKSKSFQKIKWNSERKKTQRVSIATIYIKIHGNSRF